MVKAGIIAVLDIGSTKTACFIARLDGAGQLEILGIGHQLSQGVQAGLITDVKAAEQAILSAVHAAEKMAGVSIDKVYVNVPASSLKSQNVRVETRVSGHEIVDSDINNIIQQGYDQFQSDDHHIIHCLPYNYAIDDAKGIEDPRGMFGETLSTSLHVMTASASPIKNLTHCLAKCHLDVAEMVAGPYMAGLGCLSEDEKQLGVLMLDIGGGHTGVTVYENGTPVFVGNSPIGSHFITRDVAKGLSTSVVKAERVKTLYGCAVPSDNDRHEMIDMTFSSGEAMDVEERYVSKSVLTSIIKPRAEELLEMVMADLKSNGLLGSAGPRIVLTGGGANLSGMKELAQHIFRQPVRVARPHVIEGIAESTSGPAFSVCVGMLKLIQERQTVHVGSIKETEQLAKRGGLKNVMTWFKKNF